MPVQIGLLSAARCISVDGRASSARACRSRRLSGPLATTHGGRCAYCGLVRPLHADHREPLERGGSSDIANILPACARCNLRKHLMTEDEFRARLAAEAAQRDRDLDRK
jgi:5-methylcytosine-specific restriction endonuclease McrA